MGNCGNHQLIHDWNPKLRPIRPSTVESSYGDSKDQIYQPYDAWYLDTASPLLQNIKRDIEAIDTAQKSFIDMTQIRYQNISIGTVLLSFLIAIAAENRGDLTPYDVQFDNKFPGILLRKEALSEDNRSVYKIWKKWSQHLGESLRKIKVYIKQIPVHYEYSKVIADEMLKLAYDHNIPIALFKKQEDIILENEQELGKAFKAMEMLIDNTHAAIMESTLMIDKLRQVPEVMDGALQIAAKANKHKIFTTKEVLKNYKSEIEEMVASTPTPE